MKTGKRIDEKFVCFFGKLEIFDDETTIIIDFREISSPNLHFCFFYLFGRTIDFQNYLSKNPSKIYSPRPSLLFCRTNMVPPSLIRPLISVMGRVFSLGLNALGTGRSIRADPTFRVELESLMADANRRGNQRERRHARAVQLFANRWRQVTSRNAFGLSMEWGEGGDARIGIGNCNFYFAAKCRAHARNGRRFWQSIPTICWH